MSASLHRKGKFSVNTVPPTTPAVFDCSPTSVVLTPSAGDTPDPVEPLCGDLLTGSPGATTWVLNLTSLMQWESADTSTSSLILWALEHDGEQATFTWQPGPNSKSFTGTVTVVAVPIGGDVGGDYPTQDAEWPMQGPPTVGAPAAAAAPVTAKTGS